jgi:hypothetical protein
LAALAPPPLPDRPLSYTDQDLGGPITAGGAPASSPLLPLQGVGAGTFRLAIRYTLSGPNGSGRVTSYCTRGSADSSAPAQASTGTNLAPGSGATIMTLRCPAGTIWFQMNAQPATTLSLDNVTLTKTASA